MKRYTIGKMAKLNNVTEQTLRLYDKMGLFKPAYVDEHNGYRLYDIGQSARLDIIQYLKNLGMTLKEIKEIFDSKNLELLQEKLEESKLQINNQIIQLNEQKAAIQKKIDSFELFKAAPKVGMITLEFINKRTMLYVDEKVNFYDYDLDVYEELLREFKDDLIKQALPPTIFFNPGTILRKEYVLKRKFCATEIFVFIDDKKEIPLKKETIPANMYLCIYCDDFTKEKEYAHRLFDEIESKNYTIVGDYLCESLNDILIFNDKQRNMYLRLQVPIKI